MAESPSNAMFRLEGRRALVVGGASGLGREAVRAFGAAGARVAVLDLNEEAAKAVSEDTADETGLPSLWGKVDVSRYEEVRDAVAKAAAEWGGLDIAVNAAGIASGLAEDITPEAVWRRVIDVNLTGQYFCCIEERKAMLTGRYGRIINLASMSANIVNRFPKAFDSEARQLGLYSYCSAKAGVKHMTRVMGALWAADGIRVNCISPGYMETPLTTELFADPRVKSALEEDTPVGRVGVPRDLMGVLLFLASDACEYMAGSEIVIDGGYSLW